MDDATESVHSGSPQNSKIVNRGKGSSSDENDFGLVYAAVKEIYAPIIMNDYVRPVVVVIFVGWWILCGCLIPRLEVGLDQEVSMPSVSKLLFSKIFPCILTALDSIQKFLRAMASVRNLILSKLSFT